MDTIYPLDPAMPRYFFFSFSFSFFLLLFGPTHLLLSLNQFALGSVPCSPRSFDSYKATWLMRGCWLPEWHQEKTGSSSVLDITQNTMSCGYCHGGGGCYQRRWDSGGSGVGTGRRDRMPVYTWRLEQHLTGNGNEKRSTSLYYASLKR